MKKFWKNQNNSTAAAATQLRTKKGICFAGLDSMVSLGGADTALYRGIRQNIPILDAAVDALIRLVGTAEIQCSSKGAQEEMDRFLQHVNVGRGQYGIDRFLWGYLSSLLTYGRSIGEIVTTSSGISAILWGDITLMEVRADDSPLDITICGPDEFGHVKPLPRQELLLFSALNPEPGSPYGASLFRSMPFLSEVLMKIFETVGRNWEQAGNLRYAVIYKPGCENIDQATADARLSSLSNQWNKAMTDSTDQSVRDFVAVGDVEITAIGADGPMLSSRVPVDQIVEQLIAKTGLPPAILGLDSSREINEQRILVLDEQLSEIRSAVTPALEKIADIFLRLRGWDCDFEVVWKYPTIIF